jgi:hypothetical protein
VSQGVSVSIMSDIEVSGDGNEAVPVMGRLPVPRFRLVDHTEGIAPKPKVGLSQRQKLPQDETPGAAPGPASGLDLGSFVPS